MLVEWLASPLCRGRCHTTLEQKMLWAAKTLRGTVVFFGGRRKNMYTPFFFGRVGGEKGANGGYTTSKTNMTMGNPPFEDVFPIEHGDIPLPC